MDERHACTIVAVSGGYPETYQNGFEINGLDTVDDDNSILFHAGAKEDNNKIVTNGGRVLCVTSFGENLQEATRKSVEALGKIEFNGMYFRDDIGYEFK
jgi:phosphoribosylamine---glycine ligase